jgi:hypothetical protein
MKKSISRKRLKLANSSRYPQECSVQSSGVTKISLHSPFYSGSASHMSDNLGSSQNKQYTSNNILCNSDALAASKPCSVDIQDLEKQFNLTDEVLGYDTPVPNRTVFNDRHRNLSKSIKVLDELGFNGFETRACNVKLRNSKTNMSVTDLWGFSMQKEFVRKGRYNDALKILKKKNEYENMRSFRSISRPDKPSVMDENAKRKTLFLERKKVFNGSASICSLKIKTPFSPKNDRYNKETGVLDQIMSKCDELYVQSKELKEINSDMLRKSECDYSHLKHLIDGKPKSDRIKKLSKADMMRISLLVRNL